jgi:hypothetical protein
MKTNRLIFWLGLAVYVTSFLLVGMVSPGNPATRGPIRGYTCAWGTIVAPWVFASSWSKGILPFLIPAIVISGLINPMFIGAVIALLRQRRRSFAVLRVIVLAMLPFCWISFLLFHPREGYFLWTLGMLLVLFSSFRTRSTTDSIVKPTVSGFERPANS